MILVLGNCLPLYPQFEHVFHFGPQYEWVLLLSPIVSHVLGCEAQEGGVQGFAVVGVALYHVMCCPHLCCRGVVVLLGL